MSTPEAATPTGCAMATITAAAARTIFPNDASLHDVRARATEQLDNAAREDFAAAGTIGGAVVVIGWGQRRHLR